MQPELDGRVVGPYTLVRRIGEGGMGVVFEGRATGSGLRVAVKSLRDDRGDRRSRLMREAKLTEALQHPGIVRVLEVLAEGNELFVVMELVEGESLRARLDALKARGEQLPVAESLRIAKEVAEAAGHAHQRGVVHRDLKPENVMLSPARARVLDFGLAKLREIEGGLLYQAQTQSNVTVEGQLLGTPAYMAPEQARGQEVGFAADVFSLGVVLYELLTGERPFVGGSTADLIAAITRDAPRPPSALSPLVSPELDALVLRCLAKKAADRPAMGELALALSEVAAQPRRRRLRRAPLAALAVVAFFGAGAWWVEAEHRGGAASAVAAPAAAQQVASDAERAFTAALADEHAGDEDTAIDGFERAVKLDPEHASAHLWLAVRLGFLEAENARAHYTHALSRRDRLSAIDDEYLEALRPLFQRDPPDVEGWAEAMRALVARHPADARMRHELAKTLDALGDFEGSAAAAAKAVELDPQFALALATLSQEQAYLGRFAEARQTIARCLEVSPAAQWCIWVGEFLDSNEGACQANEASAHSRIAATPLLSDGYKALAYAFAALGRPEKVIREACDRAVQREPDGFARQRLDLNLKFRVAAMYGRFDEAKELGAQLRKLVESRTDRADHALPALISAELALEQGDQAEAGAIARDYLDREEAWLANPVPNDYALANDPTPPLLTIARQAGAMSEPDYQRALADWRARWSKDLRGGWRPYLWVYGYAAPASTKVEGAAAVDALEQLGPVPAFMSDGDLPQAGVGHALLLGGRTADAVTYLKTASHNCDALTRPFKWVQAHAWLGDALAQTQDTKGACDAYAVVLERWGAAKKSVTVGHARERMTALHCPMR